MITETADPFLGDLKFNGQVNVSDEGLLANVRSSIRRGHPQVWRGTTKPDRIAIVAGGPSLNDTLPELRDLIFSGAKVVTVNGAYQWCLERNIKPSAQVIIDARAHNARFVDPAVPGCRYYLASQCHPETWDAVAGRENVAIWHASDPAIESELDAYYFGHWQGVIGGTTVGTRAIGLLRMLGYLRFDLFGFDSCFMGDQHHAYQQTENDQDRRHSVRVEAVDAPEKSRVFTCAAWHLKQCDDLIRFIRHNGQHFVLNIHGDGLLAYVLRVSASLGVSITEE